MCIECNSLDTSYWIVCISLFTSIYYLSVFSCVFMWMVVCVCVQIGSQRTVLGSQHLSSPFVVKQRLSCFVSLRYVFLLSWLSSFLVNSLVSDFPLSIGIIESHMQTTVWGLSDGFQGSEPRFPGMSGKCFSMPSPHAAILLRVAVRTMKVHRIKSFYFIMWKIQMKALHMLSAF